MLIKSGKLLLQQDLSEGTRHMISVTVLLSTLGILTVEDLQVRWWI